MSDCWRVIHDQRAHREGRRSEVCKTWKLAHANVPAQENNQDQALSFGPPSPASPIPVIVTHTANIQAQDAARAARALARTRPAVTLLQCGIALQHQLNRSRLPDALFRAEGARPDDHRRSESERGRRQDDARDQSGGEPGQVRAPASFWSTRSPGQRDGVVERARKRTAVRGRRHGEADPASRPAGSPATTMSRSSTARRASTSSGARRSSPATWC